MIEQFPFAVVEELHQAVRAIQRHFREVLLILGLPLTATLRRDWAWAWGQGWDRRQPRHVPLVQTARQG